METKNEILADLINKARQTNDSSVSRLAVSPLESSDIDLIKRELEDDKLLKELAKINSSPLAYNPFAVEFLLSDTTELLKSCIEKRTELKNLEVTLLNDSINKLLLAQKRKYEKEIADVDERYPNLDKKLAKQIKLKTTPDAVEADDTSVTEIRKYEEEIKRLNNGLKKEYEDYEDLLQEFSKDKNSGLNYLARYMELKEIYWEDFKEVFRKLKSLEVGFKTVYEIDTTLPPITNDNLLNKYYLWLKHNLLKLNKLLETEQEFTIPVSLKEGFPSPGGGNNVVNIFSSYAKKAEWGRLIFFPFQFTLDAPMSTSAFFNKKHRIRSIGASIILSSSIKSKMTAAEDYWQINIKPPALKDSLGNKYDIPFLSIACSNSNGLPIDNQIKSSTYFNANPFGGTWDFKISIQGTQHNQIDHFGADNSIIADVLLFIKVAVIV